MTTNTKLQKLFESHPHIFVTGTDTEVGKTYSSSLIIQEMLRQKTIVFPFKPISAGTESITNFNSNNDFDELLASDANNSLRLNEDAVELYKASKGRFGIDQINPIVFDEAIAPHIAASRAGLELSSKQVTKAWLAAKKMAKTDGYKVLIEGAGGWHLPLNNKELLSDWVAEQSIPVVMVVGVRLGCLNHALLTAQAIEASGCKLVGWVANFIEPESEIGRENVNYLKQKLTCDYQIDCIMEVPNA